LRSSNEVAQGFHIDFILPNNDEKFIDVCLQPSFLIPKTTQL